MIITCAGCGDQFGGVKTMALHQGPNGCLDPKSVGLRRFDSKIWRKAGKRDATPVAERKTPHPYVITMRNDFDRRIR